MPTHLPVIDLLNNIITINNYLRATQVAKLAPSIASNPAYAPLVEGFTTWQFQIWSEYFEGLVDSNLVAQPMQIAELYSLKIATQEEVQGILFPDASPVASLVSLSDDISTLIGQGQAYVTQLDAIAKSIQGADKAKVAALQAQANALQAEFDKQEDKLTQDSISSAFDVVSTAIDVAIAVGTEGDVIQPLVKGITKIGQDAITELMLTDQINQILKQLESAWEALDAASMELAQITLTVNQLDAVVAASSTALTALNAVVQDWEQVGDTANDTLAQWRSEGDQAMNEWSARMIKVSFTTATQQIPAG